MMINLETFQHTNTKIHHPILIPVRTQCPEVSDTFFVIKSLTCINVSLLEELAASSGPGRTISYAPPPQS